RVVLRITIAIGAQIGCGDAVAVLAHAGASPGEFIDVVAEEDRDIGLLFGEMAIGREIAELVIGAGDEAEAEFIERRAPRRRGHGAADRALRCAHGEAIPVWPARR